MPTQPLGAQSAHTPLSADDPREIGGYRLHARLGAGGMGVVYLARTPGGRPIALKAVREELAADPEFRRRFADEVASARSIHGLFTAQVVDSGVDAPTPWLATAYVPGPSLQQVIERHGPLPVRTVLLLVAGIAEALQAIHWAGVVHRDLKPANVLLAEDGPRVIDFGIARAADAGGLTGVGLRIGTAAYMAPEQAMGLAVTPATDVFALGALAAYVAGGVLPFGGGPESAALYRVVHEEPDLSLVPADLYDLLRRCLAKHPDDRPAPSELIDAVRAHPAVAAHPDFTDGWLPRGVSSEIAAHGEAPGLAAHGEAPGQIHAQPTLAAPTPTAPAGARQAPGSGDRTDSAPRRARRSRRVVAMLTAAFLLALGGTAYYVLDHRKNTAGDSSEASGSPDNPGRPHTPSSRPPTPSSSPSPKPGYVPDYADAELTAPDPDYEFDLSAGKVVPAETATWYLEVADGEFVLPEDSDAFVAAGYVLSPDDCVRGIETEPVTTLPYDELADERPFCVRSPDGKSIVIVRLIEAVPGEGPVTVVMSRHRQGG
ncbi:serine/threonine protein kinase [Streptomyces sp. NBC_01381]|uniref:serine/threonine-protein kinase n=1 Tax=Streptomyces sp. NBC_01381 TaxID=2903845 RepID=UPI0022503986|nr:serine/threonine-protein kinase [Streptomyces sp. NBC_01381]MCX4671306.1 serine/threonine protein kinase [Streptomyces sp. NBC_01381]